MVNPKLIHPDSLSDWIEIPLDYLPIFQGDPERFLRDTANIPTEAIMPFFRNRTVLSLAQDLSLRNPFNESKFQLEDWWTVDDFAFRYIHVDLSKNRDRAGIACCHVSHIVSITRVLKDNTILTIDVPYIVFDFIGAVSPKDRGEEIDPMLFVEVIEDASNRGAPVQLVTFDSYQSQAPIMALRDLGYIAGVLSIDRTSYSLVIDDTKPYSLRKQSTDGDISAAMNALKQALTEQRIKMPYHPLWLKEGESVEWIPDKGKVVKSVNSSDDLIQPIAGALFNLESNEFMLPEIQQYSAPKGQQEKEQERREKELLEMADSLNRDISSYYNKERKSGRAYDTY